METKEVLLHRLDETIAQLIEVCHAVADPEAAVYEGWSAKDILGHLTFWHESFARNVADLVDDRQPTPLKGRLSDLNQQGVDSLRLCTLDEVVQRLEAAQRNIQAHILNQKITLIPYRQGSRDYTPEEHLGIVNDHITGHVKGIQAANRKLRPSSNTRHS